MKAKLLLNEIGFAEAPTIFMDKRLLTKIYFVSNLL